jgi:hypothetical protein
LDRNIIRHLVEPATTGLAIPSGKFFNGHIAGDGAIFT